MAYAPEPGLDVVASIPVPRPGPRRENAPQALTFAERFGPFSTASAEPLSLAIERTGSFRLASAEITSPDSNPLAQQLLRSARLRVASADPSATPPDSTGTVPHEDAKPSSGKIASTFSRLLGIGRQANAAEKEKPAAAAAPTQTASLTMRPEEHQTRAANAALFQNTTIADMKPLTAPPLAAPPLTAQPVTVQAINFESRWSAMR